MVWIIDWIIKEALYTCAILEKQKKNTLILTILCSFSPSDLMKDDPWDVWV